MSTATRVVLPDRFLRRSADEFTAALALVGQNFWHRARRGEIEQATPLGLHVSGAYDAIQWLAGVQPVPPGYFMARSRTRYDLLDVLRITELAVNDEIGRWESVVRGSRDGALEHFDHHLAGGAREVYEWALGVRPQLGYTELLDEDVRAARDFYLADQRRAAAREAAEAASPYAHLRGELACSVVAFEQAVRAIERAVTSGAVRDSLDGPVVQGALAVGHWILGEAGHPVTGERTRATRQTIAAAVDEAVNAVYSTRKLDRHVGTAMVGMLHYALGQAAEPPISFNAPAAGTRRAA